MSLYIWIAVLLVVFVLLVVLVHLLTSRKQEQLRVTAAKKSKEVREAPGAREKNSLLVDKRSGKALTCFGDSVTLAPPTDSRSYWRLIHVDQGSVLQNVSTKRYIRVTSIRETPELVANISNATRFTVGKDITAHLPSGAVKHLCYDGKLCSRTRSDGTEWIVSAV